MWYQQSQITAKNGAFVIMGLMTTFDYAGCAIPQILHYLIRVSTSNPALVETLYFYEILVKWSHQRHRSASLSRTEAIVNLYFAGPPVHELAAGSFCEYTNQIHRDPEPEIY